MGQEVLSKKENKNNSQPAAESNHYKQPQVSSEAAPPFNLENATSQVQTNENEQILYSTVLDGESYIAFLSRLEQLALADGYTSQQVISSFRKLYYDGNIWDQVISGASGTSLPPSWLLPENFGLLENIKKNQVININGTAVDIGHFFTGIDAGNYETPITFDKMGISIFSFRSNKEFATFVGDLGSVVEAYVDNERNMLGWIPQDNAALQKWYETYASDSDMAGNVDSYSLQYDPSMSLGANLSNYYMGSSRQDNQRYTSFAREIGLGELVDGAFTGNTSDFRNGLQDEIYEFSKVYQMRNGAIEGATSWGGLIHYNRVSWWVLDYFIADLTRKVASENSGQ